MRKNIQYEMTKNKYDIPWSSLVEGVEQLDRPNSQTTMELSHAFAA